MQKLRSGLRWTARIGSLAAAPLISATALAQPTTPVQYFLDVQPIQVCPNDGLCAPVNEQQAQQRDPASTNPVIGFVDSNNVDLTRAILNQAGIDVNFLPLAPYPTDPSLRTGSDSFPNTLNLMMGNNPGQLASMDLQTLTFQHQISQGAPPNPNPAGVPLSSDPHTLNMAFVSFLNPVDVSGVYYGLSWIKLNGISVDQTTFGVQLGSSNNDIFGAVPDAPAHEIVHNLGLDHPTDNMDMPSSNLMTVARDVPLIDDVVTMLGQGRGTGMADQLNTQQIHDIIDPAHAGATGTPMLSNPFLNPIPSIDARINNGTNPADFSVSFLAGGRPDESLQTLTLTPPAGFLLERDTFTPADTNSIIANPMFSNCTLFDEQGQACQSMTLAFTGTPFMLDGQFDYTIEVCQQSGSFCDPVLLADLINDLVGGTYRYDFSDGYETTSVLQPLGDPILDANSWRPDLTIPTNLNLALFTPFLPGPPCVTGPGMTACPELDLAADRYDQLIFETVPEPPSGAVLLTGLGLWLALNTRPRRRGRAMREHRG